MLTGNVCLNLGTLVLLLAVIPHSGALSQFNKEYKPASADNIKDDQSNGKAVRFYTAKVMLHEQHGHTDDATCHRDTSCPKQTGSGNTQEPGYSAFPMERGAKAAYISWSSEMSTSDTANAFVSLYTPPKSVSSYVRTV
jgi:hypothetical protein